jgi:hypothetical protein
MGQNGVPDGFSIIHQVTQDQPKDKPWKKGKELEMESTEQHSGYDDSKMDILQHLSQQLLQQAPEY